MKMKNYILIGLILIIAIIVYSQLVEHPEIQFKDKCDIGKDIVSGPERSNYDCGGMNNCEWRPLGCELGPFAGEKKCYFACCPKNLTFSSDEAKSGIYGRCFMLID